MTFIEDMIQVIHGYRTNFIIDPIYTEAVRKLYGSSTEATYLFEVLSWFIANICWRLPIVGGRDGRDQKIQIHAVRHFRDIWLPGYRNVATFIVCCDEGTKKNVTSVKKIAYGSTGEDEEFRARKYWGGVVSAANVGLHWLQKSAQGGFFISTDPESWINSVSSPSSSNSNLRKLRR